MWGVEESQHLERVNTYRCNIYRGWIVLERREEILSSAVSSKLGPALPFPPMRVLEVYWSRALSLMCEVALRVPT